MTSAANGDVEAYLALLDGVFCDKPQRHSTTLTVNDIFRLWRGHVPSLAVHSTRARDCSDITVVKYIYIVAILCFPSCTLSKRATFFFLEYFLLYLFFQAVQVSQFWKIILDLLFKQHTKNPAVVFVFSSLSFVISCPVL